jgi:hypothetical protein
MPHWWNRLFGRRTGLSVAEAYALWAPGYPPRAHNRLMALEEQAS